MGVYKRLREVSRRALRLGWQDFWETLLALIVACVVEIGLRIVKLPRLARFLGVPLETASVVRAAARAPELPAWATVRLRAVSRVISRWPAGPGKCLRESLVAGQRLRSLGPSLRIGVTDGEQRDGFLAHAWIEIDGASLDPAAPRFLALRS